MLPDTRSKAEPNRGVWTLKKRGGLGMETGPLSPAQLDTAIVNDTDAMSRILLTLRPSIDPAQGP